MGRTQCPESKLTLDVRFGTKDPSSGCDSRVAMMQPADDRKGDDLPPVRRLALALLRSVHGHFRNEQESGSLNPIGVIPLP